MILREYIFKETTTNTALFHHKFDRTAFHPSATDVYNANNANNGQMYPMSRDGHVGVAAVKWHSRPNQI